MSRPKNRLASNRHEIDRKNQERIAKNSAESVCLKVLKMLKQRKHEQEEIEKKPLETYKTSWSYVDALGHQNIGLGDNPENERIKELVRQKFLVKNLIRIENKDNPDEIIFTPTKA